MSLYQSIVVAIDPFIDSEGILNKAAKILTKGGSIELVYVMDLAIVFPTAPYAPPMIDLPGIHQKTRDTAEKKLQELASEHGIPEENIHILIGSVAGEIRKRADEINADAIVIGSHGRHGIGLLLGSTASSVIHGTPCDILVVKIQS